MLIQGVAYLGSIY